MKSYVKPDATLVDVRLEERLAADQECIFDPNDPTTWPEGVKWDKPGEGILNQGCYGSVYLTNLLES